MNPNGDWQAFTGLLTNAETIRITQGNTDPLNQAYLAQVIPTADGGRIRPWIRIYPTTEPQILQLSVPPGISELGLFLRSLEIKRRYPFYPSPWVITVEALE